MGNQECSICKSTDENKNGKKNEIEFDPASIEYTDSTYNIWDSNPVRSMNSFISQTSFSNQLGHQKSLNFKGMNSSVGGNGNVLMMASGYSHLSETKIHHSSDGNSNVLDKSLRFYPSVMIPEETEVETQADLNKDQLNSPKDYAAGFFSQPQAFHETSKFAYKKVETNTVISEEADRSKSVIQNDQYLNSPTPAKQDSQPSSIKLPNNQDGSFPPSINFIQDHEDE